MSYRSKQERRERKIVYESGLVDPKLGFGLAELVLPKLKLGHAPSHEPSGGELVLMRQQADLGGAALAQAVA